MKQQTIDRVSLWLLVLGAGSAVVIYFTARPPVADPLLGDLFSNKKYLHELRVMGGKGNVLSAELIAEFEDLWHGRKLAGTVAALTVVVALVFRFVAARPDLFSSSATEAKRPGAQP